MKYLIKKSISWMIKNLDLISIIFATLLTWLSRPDIYQSVNGMLSVPRTPLPIFNNQSKVIDYASNSIMHALESTVSTDIVIIYFYAHWDSESLLYRKNFEKVAEKYYLKIPFIAVNCREDQSNNNAELLKIFRYPQVSAYLVQRRQFVEFMNPIEPLPLYQFIQQLHYPFHYPLKPQDVDRYLLSSDALFVSCINTTATRRSDRIVNVLYEAASIRLGENQMQPKVTFVVLSCSDESFRPFMDWHELRANTSVLMSLYQDDIPYTDEFRVRKVLDFVTTNAKKNIYSLSVRRLDFSGLKSEHLQNILRDGVSLMYLFNTATQYSTSSFQNRIHFEMAAEAYGSCRRLGQVTISNLKAKVDLLLEEYRNFHDKSRHCQLKDGRFYDISCRLDQVNYDSNYGPSDQHQPLIADNFQLSPHWPCPVSYNRSVNFLTLDTVLYPRLMNNLGLSDAENTTKVVVIDWKNEKIHQFNNEISQDSISDLLLQVYRSNLTGHSVSHKALRPSVLDNHFLAIDAAQLELQLSDPASDLVVFYYTPWCCYCASIFNLLIMLADYFSKYPHIHFTSLNTFQHDLPIKYQSEHVPALIMYPRGRKLDSYVYPLTEAGPLTLSQLIQFVLMYSGDRFLSLNTPLAKLSDPADNESSHQHDHERMKAMVSKVQCDQHCLSSTHSTVRVIWRRYRQFLDTAQAQSLSTRHSLQRSCSEPVSRLVPRDWAEYSMLRLQTTRQAELVRQHIHLLTTRTQLARKVAKFEHLTRSIEHYLTAAQSGGTSNYSALPVNVLAEKILGHFSPPPQTPLDIDF